MKRKKRKLKKLLGLRKNLQYCGCAFNDVDLAGFNAN